MTHTYTITVTNAGPSDATAVSLVDTFPSGFSQGAITPSQGTCTAGVPFTCDLGTIAAGGNATVTVAYTVPASTTDSPQVNTVSVTSAVPDPDTANDTATDSDTVTANADVADLKAVSPDPVIAGTGLTYTITVTNAGPSDAHAVTVTDSLPTGLSNATYSLDGGASTPWTGTLLLGTMIPGQSHTIVISATVDADVPLGTTLVNTATVSSSTIRPGAGKQRRHGDDHGRCRWPTSRSPRRTASRAWWPASRAAPTPSPSPTPVPRTRRRSA